MCTSFPIWERGTSCSRNLRYSRFCARERKQTVGKNAELENSPQCHSEAHSSIGRDEQASHIRQTHHAATMKNTGVHSYRDLRNRGCSRRHIERLMREGKLRRVVKGWYASVDADPSVVNALLTRARLGCLSGCKFHGLWVPPHAGLHVVYGDGPKPKPRRGTFIHHAQSPLPRVPVWPLDDCLTQVIRNHGTETSLIVLESAIHRGRLPQYDGTAGLDIPTKKRALLQKHLSVAESGSETRVRYFLQRQRISVCPQVSIPAVGRVDMLVGRKLIIECDGEAYHSSSMAFENDRRRDIEAGNAGYRTLRLSYRQIWNGWQSTQRSIMLRIGRGDHLRS